MNDLELRRDGLEELEFEPSIDAAGIGVMTENGVVTLDGHVPSYAQKLAAERAAWRVKGVKALAQNIEVRLPGDDVIHDDELAERAITSMTWATAGLRDKVKIRVSHGWVTLSGEVDWNYQRMLAESVVRKLRGVRGITNSIVLAKTVEPADVKQRISEALKRHAEVEASRIRVKVSGGGAVTIDGEVDTWDERRAVERAAWSVAGVNSVVDQIKIH